VAWIAQRHGENLSPTAVFANARPGSVCFDLVAIEASLRNRKQLAVFFSLDKGDCHAIEVAFIVETSVAQELRILGIHLALGYPAVELCGKRGVPQLGQIGEDDRAGVRRHSRKYCASRCGARIAEAQIRI